MRIANTQPPKPPRARRLPTPTYASVIGDTARLTGAALTATTAPVVLAAGGFATLGLLAARSGWLALAAAGASVGAAAGIMAVANALGRTGPEQVVSAPDSPLAEAQMPIETVHERLKTEDPDLLQRIQPGRGYHDLDAGVYTYGYKGHTLGEVHSQAMLQVELSQDSTEQARLQTQVDLAVAGAAGVGGLAAALAGRTWLGLALGAVAIFFGHAAYDCEASQETYGRRTRAHQSNLRKLEDFAAGLS